MGLDQYVYRMKKIGKATAKQLEGKNTAEIDYNKFVVMDQDYVDKNPDMFSDIKDILTPVTVIDTTIDIERIKKDYDVPEHWCIYMRSFMGGGATYGFSGDGKSVTVSLDDNKLKQYLLEENTPSYVCYMTEVYYMRKHYETQDAMYDLYDGDIQNCGYHHMSEVMIHDLNDLEGKKVLDENATNLYYHEWY